jgi:hypothetical protein
MLLPDPLDGVIEMFEVVLLVMEMFPEELLDALTVVFMVALAM